MLAGGDTRLAVPRVERDERPQRGHGPGSHRLVDDRLAGAARARLALVHASIIAQSDLCDAGWPDQNAASGAGGRQAACRDHVSCRD